MRRVIVWMDEQGYLYDNDKTQILHNTSDEQVDPYTEIKPGASADDISKLMASGATADDIVKLKYAGVI